MPDLTVNLMNNHPNIRVVAGVIYNAEGKVLLAQRREDDYPPGAWEFPGGKLEDGEKAQCALIREIREEFHIELEDISPLAELEHYDPYKGRSIHFYLMAARAFNLDSFTMRIHADYNWVERDRIEGYDLAPADRDMLKCLEKEEHA